MKAGIIGAMEQEITLLRDKVENCQTLTRAGCKIHSGMLNKVEVALLKSGIGKTAAALGATLLLELYKPDLVINIGSAGSLVPTLKVGDIVISDEVRYHDAEVKIFGYEPGQMAACPAAFVADEKLIAITQQVIKQLNLKAVRGLVVSGDKFINGAEPLVYIRHTFPQAIAVDMESAAIGHVCHQFKMPFVVVRAISDLTNQESHLSFNEFLSFAAQQSSLIVEHLLTRLVYTA